jgi:membrane carboxypeptidase/penicillin-binding protein PbpC
VRRLAWTSLADISSTLQAAVLTSEDRRFYRHSGVDSWATVGAIVRRLTGKPRRGASTISMQLTTLIDPEPQAYRTLANGGIWTPLRLTPGVPAPQNGRRVYSEATTCLLSHILSDRDSRSVTFGLESPLATRFWSAVKTGTSQEMRDNWCIGYTRHYTVGVWVGNLSGEPMRHVSSASAYRLCGR